MPTESKSQDHLAAASKGSATHAVYNIPATTGLDPITLFVEDHQPGQGSLVVRCYGCAWACYWGAMGSGSTVLQFVLRVDAGYVANCLMQSRRQFITSRGAEKREMDYLTRICESVRAFAAAQGTAQ